MNNQLITFSMITQKITGTYYLTVRISEQNILFGKSIFRRLRRSHNIIYLKL